MKTFIHIFLVFAIATGAIVADTSSFSIKAHQLDSYKVIVKNAEFEKAVSEYSALQVSARPELNPAEKMELAKAVRLACASPSHMPSSYTLDGKTYEFKSWSTSMPYSKEAKTEAALYNSRSGLFNAMNRLYTSLPEQMKTEKKMLESIRIKSVVSPEKQQTRISVFVSTLKKSLRLSPRNGQNREAVSILVSEATPWKYNKENSQFSNIQIQGITSELVSGSEINWASAIRIAKVMEEKSSVLFSALVNSQISKKEARKISENLFRAHASLQSVTESHCKENKQSISVLSETAQKIERFLSISEKFSGNHFASVE